jgi:hypothetical protein
MISDIGYKHGDVFHMVTDGKRGRNGFRYFFHVVTVGTYKFLGSRESSGRDLVLADESLINKRFAGGTTVNHAVCYGELIKSTWNNEVRIDAFIAIDNRLANRTRKACQTEGCFTAETAVRPFRRTSLAGANLPARDI